MEHQMKFVEFNIYCPRCKYRNLNEAQDPCNECLEVGAREDTHVPEYWEAENKK